MHSVRTSFSAGALPARVGAVAILCALAIPPAVYAQQAHSTTPPSGSTERRGFGYGIGSTATIAESTPFTSAPSTPAPTVAAPTTPSTAELAADSSAPVASLANGSETRTTTDQDSTVRLDDVMTPREWNATGVARLRPDERAALAAWVRRYRDSVRQDMESKPVVGSQSNGDVASAGAPVAPPTGYFSSFAAPVAPPSSASSYPVPAPTPPTPTGDAAPQHTGSAQPATPPSPPAGTVINSGLSIRDIRDSSRFITLSDGSMWDVYSADRGETSVWRIKDPIYVRTASTSVPGGFDGELVNASRNVLVRVRYIGQS